MNILPSLFFLPKCSCKHVIFISNFSHTMCFCLCC